MAIMLNRKKKEREANDRKKLLAYINSLYNNTNLNFSEEFRTGLLKTATLLNNNEDISLVASKITPFIQIELLNNKNQKELLELYNLVKNHRKGYLRILDSIFTIL